MKTNRLLNDTFIFLFFAVIWFLCVFNYQNADTYSYKLIYEGFYRTEYLFGKLCHFFYSRGVRYQYFYIICETFALLLTFSSIKYYTKSVKLILLLWLIYPFPYFVVGIRNFMGFSLVLFSSRYLLSNKKTGVIKYILLVFIASGFQTSMLIYLVLVLCKIRLPNKFCITLEGISIILGLLFLNISVLPILKVLNLDTSRLGMRLSQRNMAGFVFASILQILCSLHSFFLIKKTKKYNMLQSKENMIFRIIIIMNVLILFYVYDSVFYRLNYNIMIFSYILCGLVYSDPDICWQSKEKKISYLFSFSLAGIHALYFLTLGNYSILIKDIFCHNLLLDSIIHWFQ